MSTAAGSTKDVHTRRSPLRRAIFWIGSLFILAITGFAGHDIYSGYRTTVADTGRELDAHARIVAEQTARSLQTVDLVLRHVVEEHQSGALATKTPRELHAYLRDQAIGLIQIEGLTLVDAAGNIRASSIRWPLPDPVPNVATVPIFQTIRRERNAGLAIDGARPSVLKQDAWIFPIVRRLDTPGGAVSGASSGAPSGAFAGGVVAGGRVEYFQHFYRDVRLDDGTAIALLHRDGTLVARHPAVPAALGRPYAALDAKLAAPGFARGAELRGESPADGVDRFGVLAPVPDYPLAVAVTRDAAVALAPWRAQALGTALRTLALGALAALSLALLRRQFGRLDLARESLETSRERFALAAAGSDVGIWDWDVLGDRIYASARAREIFGAGPGPESVSRVQWFASMAIHPSDTPLRRAALRAHLSGQAPAYATEYRVRGAGGAYRWIRVRALCVRDAAGQTLRMAGSVADIDAAKRVEAALRESEERYALAMAGSNEGHWVWDIQSDGVYVSPKMNEIFGLPPDMEFASFSEYFEKIPVHPDDRERVRQSRQDHVAGKTPRMDHDYRLVMPGSGEVRWVHSRAQCFRAADGRPVRLAGSTVDATQRKRAEEALRQSEERFALAVAGSNDGVWDWDFVAGVAFESARARELQGLPQGPQSQPITELLESLRVHPDDAPRRAEALRAHLAGETPAYECDYRVLHADAPHRWIRVRALCTRDAAGQPVRMAGSVSDVDALKNAEAALRRSEERYQLAVAGSNEGLWDWDLAADSLFLSPRAQELLWLVPAEPQRPRREWLALTQYHPDDRDAVRDAMLAHLRDATSHYKVEYRLRHRSGRWRWYRQRGVAIRDAQGQATRMAGSIEDITDRKTAEAEREQLEVQLRQAQKLEAIGTLAGGIAHDFNNILAAILGYGEMAQKDAAEGSAQRRHLDATLAAANRAKSLVERILAFSRSGMAERVPVHVQSVLSEALDGVAASLPVGIELIRELGAGDAAVQGDPTQVHQVVMNLCANAVQAMKAEGTLTVTLDLVGGEGEAESEGAASAVPDEPPQAQWVRLRVRDTGSGIAPRILERIFDPFFTTKEIGVGTGLGLSLVHGIVNDLGGGIDVQSEVGVGSTFTVRLPRQGSITEPMPLTDVAPPHGNGQTILLVDDEEALVRLGEEMIAELGYEPVGFTSSRAALASMRAQPQRFNAVLTDQAMPEMTGSELVAEIRKIRPDIPIVLMSGYVTAALAARAREAGAAEVLAKPLAAGEIARSLARALRG